ncbi:MAG: glycosyltransferase family 2 protein [Ardenticatenales bacterium]
MRAASPPTPIDVVVVTWNNRAYLDDLLPALAAQTHRHHRVVVVDNGSSDGTVAWLAEAWPGVRVVALRDNVGFAVANNHGIAVGDGPWVALVNSDTVPEPGWLAALLAAGRTSPRIGSVASLMLFMDRPHVVNSAGVAVDPTGIAWDWLGGSAVDDLPFDAAATAVPVFGASAGAALYRRTALDDVALDDGALGHVFDPHYFMYLEDVDLAWRLRLRGWDAALAPGARILHVGSGTSGEGSAFKNRLLARNKVWTVVKDYPTWPLLAHLPLVIAYDLASVPYRVVVNGQTAALRGRWDALTRLRHALRARRRIQAARTAPWSFVAAAMAPLATPWSVARRYRHLRPAGTADNDEKS